MKKTTIIGLILLSACQYEGSDYDDAGIGAEELGTIKEASVLPQGYGIKLTTEMGGACDGVNKCLLPKVKTMVFNGVELRGKCAGPIWQVASNLARQQMCDWAASHNTGFVCSVDGSVSPQVRLTMICDTKPGNGKLGVTNVVSNDLSCVGLNCKYDGTVTIMFGNDIIATCKSSNLTDKGCQQYIAELMKHEYFHAWAIPHNAINGTLMFTSISPGAFTGNVNATVPIESNLLKNYSP